MIPAHLIVLLFIRIGQIILFLVLFWKAYTFTTSGSIDVYCGSTVAAVVNVPIEFPFAWIRVSDVVTDCSSSAQVTTTYVPTGFAATSYLFVSLVGVSLLYSMVCMTGYSFKHSDYDSDKKYPACDLLVSLILACLWSLDTWLAWHNLSTLKHNSHPDSVASQLSVCSKEHGYCNANQIPDFGSDVSTFLFLGLACALSCAVAVWFVFMETGLCPEEDEDFDENEDMDVDFEGEKRIPKFCADMDYASGGYQKGMPLDANKVRDKSLMQQQLMLYLSEWDKNQSETDRFSNGFTFESMHAPVATITGSKQGKVHDKFNLFKA